MKDKKTLDEILKEINAEFGPNTAVRLDAVPKVDVDVIPTGSISLDLALGVGGLPRGRIVEVFGPESGGKTTLALHIVAQAQKKGGTAAYVDMEQALDPKYCEALGVDMSKFVLSQPNSGEEALNLVLKYVESHAFDVIVVDSVAALVPTAENEGDIGAQFMGLQARLISQGIRKLTPVIARSNAVVIFINQIRMNIGGPAWGNPETTPGGKSLKFAASVRLDIRRINTLKEKEELVGNTVKVKVAKNKVAAPFKIAEFVIRFGKGIDYAYDVFKTGVVYDLIKREGNTYSFEGEQIGVGESACRKRMQDDSELRQKIVEALLKDDDEKTEEGKTELPQEEKGTRKRRGK